MADSEGRPLQPAPLAARIGLFALAARRFLDHAAVFTTSGAGELQGVELGEPMARHMEDRAIEAAAEVERTIALLPPPGRWQGELWPNYLMPSYVGFWRIFVGLMQRWGFEAGQEAGESGPTLRFRLEDAAKIVRPLVVAWPEYVLMDRTLGVFERGAEGAIQLVRTRRYVASDRGVFEAEAGTAIRVVGRGKGPFSVLIGDARHEVNAHQAAFVRALLEAHGEPVTFTAMARRYRELRGKNPTDILNGLPAEVRRYFRSVRGYQFVPDPKG